MVWNATDRLVFYNDSRFVFIFYFVSNCLSLRRIVEARDCLCQFRMEVLGKPVIRNWITAPRLNVEAILLYRSLLSCFENFLGFHPQVQGITLLLLERVLLTPSTKIRIISETPKDLKEKVDFFFRLMFCGTFAHIIYNSTTLWQR